MLNKTLEAYKKVKHELFVAKTVSKIIVSLLTATYFICAIIFKFGNYYVNLVLASLFGFYTIFDIFSFRLEKSKKKIARRIYKSINFTIRLLAIGSSVYALYYATGDVNPLVPVTTTLVIILWIVQVIFELVIYVFERGYAIFIKAIKEDLSVIISTVNKGKEIAEAMKDTSEMVVNKVSETIQSVPKKFSKFKNSLRTKFTKHNKKEEKNIQVEKNEVEEKDVVEANKDE